MAKEIHSREFRQMALQVIEGSAKEAAITSLRYLTALHSKRGLSGKYVDPSTFHSGLLQIRPGSSYLEAVAYWSGEIHPSEHDLLRYVEDSGLSEHFGQKLRKKPANYTPLLGARPEFLTGKY